MHPNCSAELMIRNRMGVEIDRCTTCKGVWLDRGELEKVENMRDNYDDYRYRKYHYGSRDYDHDDNDDDDGYYYRRRKHKKRGF